MRTVIMAVAAAAVLGAALPAAALAQDYPPPPSDREAGPPPPPGDADRMGDPDRMDRRMDHDMDREHGEWSLSRREEWLAGRIERASDRGWLSGAEEQRGRAELAAIRREQARLRDRDGGRLSEADHTYVSQRIDDLNRTLRWTGENPPAPWMTGQ